MATGTPAAATDLAVANERIFREVVAANERGDIGGVLSYYTDESTYVEMPQPDEVVRGRSGIRGVLEQFYAVMDTTDGGFEIVSLTANESRAVGELEIAATYLGDGAPPDGSRVVLRMCVVLRIEAGRVVEERVYMDSAAAQIGRYLDST